MTLFHVHHLWRTPFFWGGGEQEVFVCTTKPLLYMGVDTCLLTRFTTLHWKQLAVTCLYWAIQQRWFARVSALCNLSRKKSREVAAHFRADF